MGKPFLHKYSLIIALFLSMVLSTVAYSQDSGEADRPEGDDEVNYEELFSDEKDLLDDTGPKFKITGQYKNLFVYQKVGQFIGRNPYNFLVHRDRHLFTDLNRIRLTPEFSYSDKLVIHVDFDNELIWSNYNKNYEFDNYWRNNTYNDLLKLSWEPYYDEHILYRTRLHRAYIKATVKSLTVTAGRQQVRFGSGRLWNPLDILNPISPTYIEGAEEQKGTDALRVDYFFGAFTELSLVYDQKLHNDSYDKITIKDSNALARFKTTVNETEFSLMGGRVSHRWIGGADISTILFDGMLRGSIIFSFPEYEDWYFQANTGYEYTFKKGVYFLVEYFYNQNSFSNNRMLKYSYTQVSLFGTNEYFGMNQHIYKRISNQFLTFNQHYAGIALGYDIHPLVRGELFSIYDFQGFGMFISPTLTISAHDNVEINTGALIGVSLKDRISDFGFLNGQNLYFFQFKYYF